VLRQLAQVFDLAVQFTAEASKVGMPLTSLGTHALSRPEQIFRIIDRPLIGSQGDRVQLPVRWRYKIDRWRSQFGSLFRRQPSVARPRLCPACGTLVGSTAGRCHQCGANLTFSLAAASRSLSKLLPQTAPVSYGILGLCCILYGVSLLITIKQSGFQAPSGGLGALFGLGGINGLVLVKMGSSSSFLDLAQPWRLITAIFLHGSLLHLGFNMWVMMDLAPTIEELYGSARFLFVFIVTGISGYILSFVTGHPNSVGASGSLLGLVGLLLALTTGRQNMAMRMLRSQLLYWLAYIVVLGILMPGIDNYAHVGGFVAGFLLGKVMADRQPADVIERRRAYALGWTTGFVVLASFVFMLLNYFGSPIGLG
jgi:rhomboid protease GluP